MQRSRWPRPRTVLVALLGYLALTWGLFLLVDVFHLFEVRWRPEPDVLPLFYELYAEGRLTEWLQWGTLGVAAVACGHLAGILRERDRTLPDASTRGAAAFWALLGIALALMLVEDAGDPRHQLSRYALVLVDDPQPARSIVELVYYTLLAAIPVYALLRHGRHVWHHRPTRWLLLIGFAAYGVAAFASASRRLGMWYATAGDWIHTHVFGDRIMAMPAGMHNTGLENPTGYMLMDVLWEESTELVGAAMLLAAALAYLWHVHGRSPAPPAGGARTAAEVAGRG